MTDLISVEQLQNLNPDATSISEVATSRIGGTSGGALTDTITTRLGDTVDSMVGRLKKLGYQVPVEYDSSIEFTVNDSAKTVQRDDGIIYAPNVADLPLTTSGTWAADDEDKFYPIFSLRRKDFDTLAGGTAFDLDGQPLFEVGEIYYTQGYSTKGDGGRASYQCISITETGVSAGVSDNGYFYVDLDGTNFAQFEVNEPDCRPEYFGTPSSTTIKQANRSAKRRGVPLIITNRGEDILITEQVDFIASTVEMRCTPVFASSGLSTTDYMFTLEGYISVGSSNQMIIRGAYKLDGNSEVNSCFWVKKGETFKWGDIDAYGYIVSAMHFEPYEDFASIENGRGSLRAQGGQHYITGKIPDLTAVFANKIAFDEFEGRSCSDNQVVFELAGSATEQKFGLWVFNNSPQFTTSSDTAGQDYCIYVDRTGTGGEVVGLVMVAPTIEDTRSSAITHTATFGASNAGLIQGWTIIGSNRKKYSSHFGTNVSRSQVNVIDASSLDVTDDYSMSWGNARFNRVVVEDGGTFFTESGTVSDIEGESNLTDVRTLVTANIGNADSFRANGATWTQSVAHTNYGKTHITIVSASTTSSNTGEFCFIAYNTSSYVINKVSGVTGISATAAYNSGDDNWTITFTNNTGAGIDFRDFTTQYR